MVEVVVVAQPTVTSNHVLYYTRSYVSCVFKFEVLYFVAAARFFFLPFPALSQLVSLQYYKRTNTLWVIKNRKPNCFPYLRKILTDLQSYFFVTFSRKFAIKWSLSTYQRQCLKCKI